MPSLQLLSFLVHGLRQTPVEFVVTFRSDEPPPGRHRLRPLQTELYRAPAPSGWSCAALTKPSWL